jgi:hypothetical protein
MEGPEEYPGFLYCGFFFPRDSMKIREGFLAFLASV